MRRNQVAVGMAAIALLVGGLVGCGGDGSDAAERTQAPAASKPAAKKAPTGPSAELRTVRQDFKENFAGVTWYPPVTRIEGIYGGWLYIETDLHPDNPDTDEIARSICSGGLGVGIGTIEDFNGVSVYGLGSEKVKECKPFEQMD